MSKARTVKALTIVTGERKGESTPIAQLVPNLTCCVLYCTNPGARPIATCIISITVKQPAKEHFSVLCVGHFSIATNWL